MKSPRGLRRGDFGILHRNSWIGGLCQYLRTQTLA
jgi:hypothetical protein